VLTDEQIAVVAEEMQLPRIAVRFVATQRESLGAPYTPADLIGHLAAQMAVNRRAFG
jgi:hypothetical protein